MKYIKRTFNVVYLLAILTFAISFHFVAAGLLTALWVAGYYIKHGILVWNTNEQEKVIGIATHPMAGCICWAMPPNCEESLGWKNLGVHVLWLGDWDFTLYEWIAPKLGKTCFGLHKSNNIHKTSYEQHYRKVFGRC